MPYILPLPIRSAFEHFASYDNVFTPEECQRVIDIAVNQGWKQATTLGGVNAVKRRAQVSWLPWKAEENWLWDKIGGGIIDANMNYFGFELSSMSEDLQITRYEDIEAGHYDWHQDIGPGNSSMRKLSFVVQLTDPSEYEGGSLEIFMAQQDGHKVPPKTQGSVVFFPSYEPHRVTQLTKGVRHSLVGWVSGAPYR